MHIVEVLVVVAVVVVATEDDQLALAEHHAVAAPRRRAQRRRHLLPLPRLQVEHPQVLPPRRTRDTDKKNCRTELDNLLPELSLGLSNF